MIKLILSFLLHHANRSSREKEFYAIKDALLQRYGKLEGYDLQFIEGVTCLTCDGTGTYSGWNYRDGYFEDWCWNCGGTGLFKLHRYVILKRIRFGEYIFHSPLKKYCVKRKFDLKVQIRGYVNHQLTPFGETATIVLYLLYNPKFLMKTEIGYGYRCRWWYPRNWAVVLLQLSHRIYYRGRKHLLLLWEQL